MPSINKEDILIDKQVDIIGYVGSNTIIPSCSSQYMAFKGLKHKDIQ
jgi:hypothetical protein